MQILVTLEKEKLHITVHNTDRRETVCCVGSHAVNVFRTNDGHFHMSVKIENANLICLCYTYTTSHMPVSLPSSERSQRDNLTKTRYPPILKLCKVSPSIYSLSI